MNNSKVEYKPKLPRVKKTYAFHADVAELIETHKYENRGRELDFVSQAIRNYCAEIDGEKAWMCCVTASIKSSVRRWTVRPAVWCICSSKLL